MWKHLREIDDNLYATLWTTKSNLLKQQYIHDLGNGDAHGSAFEHACKATTYISTLT